MRAGGQAQLTLDMALALEDHQQGRLAGKVALHNGELALAGWPLHAEFLAVLSSVARSMVLTPVSYTLAPAIGQLVTPEAFVFVPATDGSGGRLVAALPAPLVSLPQVATHQVLGRPQPSP